MSRVSTAAVNNTTGARSSFTCVRFYVFSLEFMQLLLVARIIGITFRSALTRSRRSQHKYVRSTTDRVAEEPRLDGMLVRNRVLAADEVGSCLLK